MRSVLVAFSTNAGSTEAVATAVAEELSEGGAPVDVRRIRDVRELHAYRAVIVGAPIIFSEWHPALGKRLFAQLFIRKPGDFRNWQAIRAWAAEMRRVLTRPRVAVQD